MLPKEETEENIRKKKDKKLSKHFEILLNNQKFKIVKLIFKEKETAKRKGKTIQLISKIDKQILERTNVKIEINQNDKSYKIDGDWASAHWGIGKSYVEYWINEIVEN